MRQFLLKLFKAKKRNEIRQSKLWEITRVWGYDLFEVEQEPVQPEPFQRPVATSPVDRMRVHAIKSENNVTNLTKDPDLL